MEHSSKASIRHFRQRHALSFTNPQNKSSTISDAASPSRSKNHGIRNPLLRVYFLNLLTPASPIRPRPRSNIVAGSGTGVPPLPLSQVRE